MNYRDHLTHWGHIPLKNMTQAELIKVIQEQHRMILEWRETVRERYQQKSDYFVSGG